MRSVRLLFVLLAFFTVNALCAQETPAPEGREATHEAKGEGEKKKLDVAGEMFGHVGDSHQWHLFGMSGHPIAIPLPVIAYTPTKGLSIFSASNFNFHEMEENIMADGRTHISNSYNGFHLEKGIKEKLVAEDGSKVYDFSITKNVLAMFLSIALLLWIMVSVGRKYQRTGANQAPSGFQNAVEPVITFIRDEVAKPNLGYRYMKFMPLLLTLFFFIWINNLLGLLPFGFNFTGNIAVTLCLAIVSFIVMVVNGNKHFWSHLLNPPGVPFGIKLLLVPIEIISLFVKPVALTIRLFANILAGHIVILSVVFMIFIFAGISKMVGVVFVPVSVAFSIFMFFLELLVAAIQAFIFTNLTAVFIGQAIEEAHHHEDAHDHHGIGVNEQTGQNFHVSAHEVIA
jgi:F-type H+-transporting ATPase subunit a